MENIILIGMPGTGKSTLGILLAKELGYGFIDSDLVIQSREERSLAEIIRTEGLDGFLKIEEKVNTQLCADRCIIATGGSAVYSPRAMRHLKELGKIVYLRLSYEEIERRLSDLVGRGVAIKGGFTLKDLYEERIPLYEKYAEITLDLQGKTVEESVAIAVEALKSWKQT